MAFGAAIYVTFVTPVFIVHLMAVVLISSVLLLLFALFTGGRGGRAISFTIAVLAAADRLTGAFLPDEERLLLLLLLSDGRLIRLL
jgi:hypothetical protein